MGLYNPKYEYLEKRQPSYEFTRLKNPKLIKEEDFSMERIITTETNENKIIDDTKISPKSPEISPSISPKRISVLNHNNESVKSTNINHLALPYRHGSVRNDLQISLVKLENSFEQITPIVKPNVKETGISHYALETENSITSTKTISSKATQRLSRLKGIDYDKITGRPDHPKRDSDYYPALGYYNPNYNIITKSDKKSNSLLM
jgi:hypothetical protein